MENFWDLRYSEPGFAYGREPNDFFRRELDELPPGTCHSGESSVIRFKAKNPNK